MPPPGNTQARSGGRIAVGQDAHEAYDGTTRSARRIGTLKNGPDAAGAIVEAAFAAAYAEET